MCVKDMKTAYVSELGYRSCDECECENCGYPFDGDDRVVVVGELFGGNVYCGKKCARAAEGRQSQRVVESDRCWDCGGKCEWRMGWEGGVEVMECLCKCQE